MNIEETDAVVKDENGNERFRTEEIEFRPLGNTRNEIIWATLATISCTGLLACWFYYLAVN